LLRAVRFSRLFAFAVLLLLCAVTGAESSFAAESIPSSPSTNEVTVDGKWTTPDEWRDATEMRAAGGWGYVCIKDDKGSLYVLMDFTSDRTLDDRDMARVRLDARNDKSDSPQADDYVILVDWIAGAIITRAAKGNGSAWVSTGENLGVKVGSSNDSRNDPYSVRPHMIYEFAIPREILGDGPEIGLSATAGHEMGTVEAKFMNLPRRHQSFKPSTWSTLTFATPFETQAPPPTTTLPTQTSIASTQSSERSMPNQAGVATTIVVMIVVVLAILGVYYLRKRKGKEA
jgi:hypothetical protein